jgi:hypothetical protein
VCEGFAPAARAERDRNKAIPAITAIIAENNTKIREMSEK